jgi:hypothetical protein
MIIRSIEKMWGLANQCIFDDSKTSNVKKTDKRILLFTLRILKKRK